jgi:hypothetical protein
MFAGQPSMTQYEYSAHVAIHEPISASFYKEAICFSNSSKKSIYIFIMDEMGGLKNNKKMRSPKQWRTQRSYYT